MGDCVATRCLLSGVTRRGREAEEDPARILPDAFRKERVLRGDLGILEMMRDRVIGEDPGRAGHPVNGLGDIGTNPRRIGGGKPEQRVGFERDLADLLEARIGQLSDFIEKGPGRPKRGFRLCDVDLDIGAIGKRRRACDRCPPSRDGDEFVKGCARDPERDDREHLGRERERRVFV